MEEKVILFYPHFSTTLKENSYEILISALQTQTAHNVASMLTERFFAHFP